MAKGDGAMIYDYYLAETMDDLDIESKKIELGEKKKKEVLNKSKKKNIDEFYPKPEDLQNLPENSTLIKISFILKKPYTSKDEGEFHIINGRIFENPIVRDKFLGLPMVRPTTWKGHLRFAAERVDLNEDETRRIIRRLFGSKSGDENTLKGRLYFFPTFFEKEAERDVITPLKRDTRTPTKRGPIPLEVMKPSENGEFNLLYVPYPKGKDFKEEQIKEDLKFLVEALKLMFYTYGFSAKKTAGFGVIEEDIKGSRFYIKGTKKNLDKGNMQKKPDKVTSLKDISKIISREGIATSSKIAEFEIKTLDELESLLDKLNEEGIW